MSFWQRIEQYQSKYSCKVQNVLLLFFYKDYKEIKKKRVNYTFSELFRIIN